MNYLLRCLHDLATEVIVGKIMYKFDKQCKLYILGQGSTYLFIYLFIILNTGLPVRPSHKFGFRSSVSKNGFPEEGGHEGLVPRNDVLSNSFI